MDITALIIAIVVFISLYITIVWVSFLYLWEPKRVTKKGLPNVTIVIPAYNEEEGIEKTISSVVSLDYPKNKLKIVVVNDGSTDRTGEVAEELIKKYEKEYYYEKENNLEHNFKVNFEIINKKNDGKAKALNVALEKCSTELFACVDADSYVEKDSLIKMIPHFEGANIGATISAIKVNEPKNIYEKLQRMEYILAIMTRKLMAFINTLSVTPGVLSVYRTDVLKTVKGFDEKSLTEDFEIAMRLKYYGYDIDIETSAITYTNVPDNFSKLWRQRVRWYRGFVESHKKYRQMFLNKRFGFLAYFQLPLNVIGILLLIGSVVFVSYGSLFNIYYFIRRAMLIKGYFWTHIIGYTKLKDIILTYNAKIMIPVIIALFLGILIFYLAHKEVREKIRYPFTIWAFFVILPVLTALHWLGALTEEALKLKKKW
ncbi:glycosyltransferase family 2 protein [Candidatus Woesearchaeota archaeon]|nr:glycosyltransferase family 2 protein [Candidatus Woesearchaeota archaeon]